MTRPCPRCGRPVVLAELPPRQKGELVEPRFALLDAEVTETMSGYARVAPFSAARFAPTSAAEGHAMHWTACLALSSTEQAWSRRFPFGDLPPRHGEVTAFPAYDEPGTD